MARKIYETEEARRKAHSADVMMWQLRHPEKVKAYQEKRKEQRKAYAKKYYQEHKEKYAAYQKEYQKTHAEEIRAYRRKYYRDRIIKELHGE